MELPATLDTSALGFDLDGWDTYVSQNTVLATGVSCLSSGFLKVGALLFVALLLF